MKEPTIRVLLLTLVAVLLSNGGCSRELTRPQALELLKETVEPDLRGSIASIRSDIWIPTPEAQGKNSRLLAKNFLEMLREAGYLRGPTTRDHTLVWTPGVDYFYWPVSGEEVESSQEPRLRVLVSKPTITEVTGITGDEDTAIAECTITYSPTETFKAITKMLDELATKGQDPRVDRWANGVILNHGWPTEESLVSRQTSRYAFRRYDDGWRVEGAL